MIVHLLVFGGQSLISPIKLATMMASSQTTKVNIKLVGSPDLT